MSAKEMGSFSRLQRYSFAISKIFQIAVTYADFFWKDRVLRWMSWKKNTQGYTENENKVPDL